MKADENQQSEVGAQQSEVGIQKSAVGAGKSEDGGQTPQVGAQTSEGAAPAPQGKEHLALSTVLGTVQALTPLEQASLYACEEVVRSGWYTFVQVGLALAQIRDQRLYRMEYESFEAYCQVKWQYGRRYVNQLISAAQVFTHLGAISSLKKPEHETQVRPLVGLTPEQAKLAWERAVEKAGGGQITARLVKAAVQELGLGSVAQPAAVEPERRETKAEKRRLIDDAIGELLLLVSQKASYATLTEKIQRLSTHISALFAKAGSK